MPLAELAQLLQAAPAKNVGDVLAIMSAIDGALGDADGVRWFNFLYHRVTERVVETLTEGVFENPDFVERLDVVFANLYFAALTSFVHNLDSTPRAWYPLFAADGETGIARVQFALAGMNAHINRDLMMAVVSVFQELGTAPDAHSKEKADYDRLNPVLEAVETEVRASFLEGPLRDIDSVFEKVDTIIANWNLIEARNAAWSHAETLWQIRNIDFVKNGYIEGLDGLVGFAGRGLLIPTGKLAGI